MTFDQLLALVGYLPWFDLATLVQLTHERRESLINQLYRFSKAGKLIPLRRGMYVLSERYRKTQTQPAELAGVIYRPSYLSGSWALSYYGLIPESAAVYTSVTTRSPKRFVNALGEYAYQNVKRELFFGFSQVGLGGGQVRLAWPEKALVDTWYLEPGEWTETRMVEMRFANSTLLDRNRLEALVLQIGKPRLLRAFSNWACVVDELEEGVIDL